MKETKKQKQHFINETWGLPISTEAKEMILWQKYGKEAETLI